MLLRLSTYILGDLSLIAGLTEGVQMNAAFGAKYPAGPTHPYFLIQFPISSCGTIPGLPCVLIYFGVFFTLRWAWRHSLDRGPDAGSIAMWIAAAVALMLPFLLGVWAAAPGSAQPEATENGNTIMAQKAYK